MSMKQSKYASCGHTTHGLSKLKNGKQYPLHHVWCEMRQRCSNPKSKSYKDYGGRGIRVCSSWSDFKNFYEWAFENGFKPGLTIERKNNNGNYDPDNCTWIPRGQQRRNNRRVIKITLNGKTKILIDWVKDSGVKYSTVYARLKKGMPLQQALQKNKIAYGGRLLW